MKNILMLCLLFKVSIIFGNEIDTLSLLTGGNKKYWERIDSQNVIDNYGIVFCVDSTLEWYDKNRTIHFHLHKMNYLKNLLK